MLTWFHKIQFYYLNKRILWKLYLLYTDYLISPKYKKCSPGKYATLLYVAVSIYTLDFYKVWLQKIRFASIAEFRSDLILFEQSVSYLFLPPCIEEVCVMSKNNEKTQREGKWWIFWDRKYGVITLLNIYRVSHETWQ